LFKYTKLFADESIAELLVGHLLKSSKLPLGT
jgi:hypothetical protein